MKLLDILVEYLKEWPEGHAAVSMDYDGYCNKSDGDGYGYKCADDLGPIMNGKVWGSGQWTGFSELTEVLDGLIAEDFETAIVTREQWQAERDRKQVQP